MAQANIFGNFIVLTINESKKLKVFRVFQWDWIYVCIRAYMQSWSPCLCEFCGLFISETPFRPELDWREFTHSTQQAVDGANSKTQTISSARCRYTEGEINVIMQLLSCTPIIQKTIHIVKAIFRHYSLCKYLSAQSTFPCHGSNFVSDEKSAPDSNLQVDRLVQFICDIFCILVMLPVGISWLSHQKQGLCVKQASSLNVTTFANFSFWQKPEIYKEAILYQLIAKVLYFEVLSFARTKDIVLFHTTYFCTEWCIPFNFFLKYCTTIVII